MQFLSKAGKWITSNILEPLFGNWWAEITFLIIFILFAMLAAYTVTIVVKYLKLKNKYNSIDSDMSKLKSAQTQLVDENRCLKSDKQNLEDSLMFVKTELEARNKLLENLEEEKQELTLNYNKSLEDIEKLSAKIKRSESAKKAAETRKKNKEKKSTICKKSS